MNYFGWHHKKILNLDPDLKSCVIQINSAYIIIDDGETNTHQMYSFHFNDIPMSFQFQRYCIIVKKWLNFMKICILRVLVKYVNQQVLDTFLSISQPGNKRYHIIHIYAQIYLSHFFTILRYDFFEK